MMTNTKVTSESEAIAMGELMLHRLKVFQQVNRSFSSAHFDGRAQRIYHVCSA
jgi:hypothetical protein